MLNEGELLDWGLPTVIRVSFGCINHGWARPERWKDLLRRRGGRWEGSQLRGEVAQRGVRGAGWLGRQERP